MIRAARKMYANGSVILALEVTRANNISPPNIGRPSIQFACVRAKRCINGDRFELSGVNSFAATSLVKTIFERIDSIKINKNRAQLINPSNEITVGEFIFFLPCSFVTKPFSDEA